MNIVYPVPYRASWRRGETAKAVGWGRKFHRALRGFARDLLHTYCRERGDFLHGGGKFFAKKSTSRFSPHDRHLQAFHSAKAERAKTMRRTKGTFIPDTFSSGIPSGQKFASFIVGNTRPNRKNFKNSPPAVHCPSAGLKYHRLNGLSNILHCGAHLGISSSV